MQYKAILQDYYAKMAKKTKEPSLDKNKLSRFFSDINRLVIDTDKLLDLEKPTWYRDIWEERKLQLAILTQSLKNALYENEIVRAIVPNSERVVLPVPDEKLFLDCHFVSKYSSTTIFPSIYNEFPDRLSRILKSLKPNNLHRSSPDNMSLIKQEVEKHNREKIKHLINMAKLEFLAELKKSDALVSLEERLEEISGQEFLEQLVAIIKKQATQEIRKIRDYYVDEIQKMNENRETMENAFSHLVNQLGIKMEMIRKLEEKYPEQLKLLEAYSYTNPAGAVEPAETKETPGNAKLVAQFGAFSLNKATPEITASQDELRRNNSASFDSVDLTV